jgi:hypothetical protein
MNPAFCLLTLVFGREIVSLHHLCLATAFALQLLSYWPNMANILSPLTLSGQNSKSAASITLNSVSKRFDLGGYKNSVYEHGRENIFMDEATMTITSSPFSAEVDVTKQSPITHHSPSKSHSPKKHSPLAESGIQLTEDALRENEARSVPNKIQEDAKRSPSSNAGSDSMSPFGAGKGSAWGDDTCFSTFSAVPNVDMTTFAQTGQSPSKSHKSSPSKSSRPRDGARTPIHSRPTTPGTARQQFYDAESPSSSPTPRHKHRNHPEDTSDLILDFTEQLNSFGQPTNRSPHRSSPSKPSRHPDLAGYPAAHRLRSPTREGFRPATPSEARHLTNLLDFDLPPAPTPRSIPTITPRELESLKSNFLSQISSLNASLSGKDAEINSLKSAKDDAENRVGEALEQIRDLKEKVEDLLNEKDTWEKRDREMQVVLRNVKEEIILNQKEHEELVSKTTDLEKKVEEAEARAADAESKLAGYEAGSTLIAGEAQEKDHGDVSTPGSSTNRAVEIAVEKVARELHGLYKAKHETKVGALKKSYEARWEKRIKEMQAQIDDLGRENEELRIGRDATLTGVDPAMLAAQAQPLTEQQQQKESDEAKIQREAEAQLTRELSSQVERLASEVEGVKKENAAIRTDLETSRRENSELVAAVEQMLLLETDNASSASAPAPAPVAVEQRQSHAQAPPASNVNAGLGIRGISRASGLKGPGFGTVGGAAGEARFGMMKRSVSGASGHGLGAGLRSGIMSDIERMGRGGG